MKGLRVLSIILGILMVIVGIICIATPGLSYMLLIVLLTIGMLLSGLFDIVTWSARRKRGKANGASLASAIISFALAVFLIICLGAKGAEFVVGLLLIYVLMIWLIATGIVRIIMSIAMKTREGASTGAVVLSVILGILMILIGIIGFAHPVVAALAIGLIAGIDLLVSGLDLIFTGVLVGSEVSAG